MRKRLMLLLVLIFAITFLFVGCDGSNVVAVVNGENIYQQELEREVEFNVSGLEMQGVNFSSEQGKELLELLRRDVLEQLIEEKLLLQEVKNRKIEPSLKDVQEEIDEIKGSFESEVEYRKFLTANGLNETKLKDYMKKQLSIRALYEEITSDIGLEDGVAEQYYNDNIDEFAHEEQRNVRHILIGYNESNPSSVEVDSKLEALRIIEKINQGDDFAELAQEYSEDLGSGGSIFTVTRDGGFVKEFEDAVFFLSEGEYTKEPVKTQFGYHIIKLEEIIPARVQSFEEAKSQIEYALTQQSRDDKFYSYLDNLKEKSKIENRLWNKNDKSMKK